MIQKAKSYEDMRALLGNDDWTVTGKQELDAIQDVLDQREQLRALEHAETIFEVAAAAGEGVDEKALAEAGVERPTPAGAPATGSPSASEDGSTANESGAPASTPPERRENPEPPGSWAPLGPGNALKIPIPAAVLRDELPTPTPGGGVRLDDKLP